MGIFVNTFLKTFGNLLALGAFLIIIALFINFLQNNDNFNDFKFIEGNKESNNIITILEVNGPIVNDSILPSSLFNFEIISPDKIKDYIKQINELETNVLIVSINSPGGTVSASHEIYQLIKKLKSERKLKIYFHTTETLASGAYWFSLAADKIFANYGALIGSIGVKGPDWIYFDNPVSMSTGILGSSIETKNGIQIFSNTAGKSKDILNPFRKPTNDEKNQLKLTIDQIYEDFVVSVSKQRKIEINKIKNDIGAFIYNANEAKENYLIDGINNLEDTVSKIAKENKFDNYKIYKNSKDRSSFFNRYLLSLFNNSNLNQNVLHKNKICNNFKNNIVSISPNFLFSC